MIPNKKRRSSAQRNRIYGLIRANYGHPTAQWIYETLKKEIPQLSLGNVYRNLRILEEDGLVRSHDFGDGMEHFDAVTKPHNHFICEKCGSISDFDIPFDHTIVLKNIKGSGKIIKGHVHQFYGICEKCVKKKKHLENSPVASSRDLRKSKRRKK